MGRRRLHQLLGLAIAAGLVAAACGRSGDNGPRTSGAPSTGVTETSAASETTSTIAGPSSPSSAPGASSPGTTARPPTTRAGQGGAGRTPTTARPRGMVQITAPPPTAPAEPPQAGGSLTLLAPTESNGFDPTKGTGSAMGGDMHRMFAVYDALVYQDPATGNVVPQLAGSMTSPDAKTWVMKLRQGVKFTDGTPYDAEAVRFNWDRHADPTNSSPWAATLKHVTYQVLDPLTVQITLNKPNSQFPRVISRQLSYIASPTAITAAGSDQAYNSMKPVGAGPFVLLSWVRDSQAVMVRNPGYWNAPRPYLDSIVFKVVPDEAQRAAAMKAGAAEMALTANPLSAQDMTSNKGLGLQLFISPSVAATGFGMNLSRAPFNDRNIRRAVQMAIDLDQYNKVVNGNLLESPRQMFPSNYPYADPSLTFPPAELAQAQKLVDASLAQSGATDVQFTYTYVTGTPTADAAAQNLQKQIERLDHVKVTLRGESVNQYVADLVQKNFDACTFSYAGVDPESDWAESVITNGSRNFYGYSNPNVDSAIADSRTTVDSAARNRNLQSAQRALIDDLLFFPLNRGGFFYVAKGSVKDLASFDDGGLLSDRAWLKTRA